MSPRLPLGGYSIYVTAGGLATLQLVSSCSCVRASVCIHMIYIQHICDRRGPSDVTASIFIFVCARVSMYISDICTAYIPPLPCPPLRQRERVCCLLSLCVHTVAACHVSSSSYDMHVSLCVHSIGTRFSNLYTALHTPAETAFFCF
jgi:hypothetical protein